QLDDHLLDGLRADAADDLEVKRRAVARRRDRPGGPVKLNLELGRILRVKVLAKTAGDCLLDVRVDLLTLAVLVARDSIHNPDQFLAHYRFLFSWYSVVFPFTCGTMPAATCTTGRHLLRATRDCNTKATFFRWPVISLMNLSANAPIRSAGSP